MCGSLSTVAQIPGMLVKVGKLRISSAPLGQQEPVMLRRAIGIIFGDVGTSPLYVFASIFNDPPNHSDVLATMSMIFWTLTLVALIK